MTTTKNSCPKSSCCCRHTFWTWLLALLLAIYLFWHWQHGHGPTHASECCAAASSETATPTSPVTPASTTAESPSTFSFTASNAHGYNGTGDASGVAWAAKSTDLANWFKGGNDWVITGDANKVTLSGNVDSEETKLAKGSEAQAFFGTGVTVDNQLEVKAADILTPEASMPVAAKLYFDTGKTSLPSDTEQTLAATLDWLKSNSAAKAIISGYSDPRGNHERNAELSKNRAKAVKEMLKAAGIDETRIEMRKPQDVEASGDLAEARRVEVTVE